MGGTGRKLGEMGRHEQIRMENVGTTSRMEEKWGRKWDELREKWDRMPSFHSPIFPIFRVVENLPHSTRFQNQLTALTDRKMGIFATH